MKIAAAINTPIDPKTTSLKLGIKAPKVIAIKTMYKSETN
jgi:hypothetical protein